MAKVIIKASGFMNRFETKMEKWASRLF